jgi:hypothetical protein
MRKTTYVLLAAAMFCGTALIQSCSDDEDEMEFVADSGTFAGFESWSLDFEADGADPALGMAHGGNDETVNRKVYFKNGQNPVNGEYPKGTVIVKRSTSPGGLDEVTAMVKRGGDFNSANNGWEWFMLMPDGSIAEMEGMPARGANLMNGMCGGCHAGAANQDYVFSKS